MYTIIYYELISSKDNHGQVNMMTVESEHGLNEALKKLDYSSINNQRKIMVFRGKLQEVEIETKFVVEEA